MMISIDLRRFEPCHILVVGDVMLDRYLWGEVSRISPEAPVPVFQVKKQSEARGGAGNVVSNLLGLGCRVSIIGVHGPDESGRRLMQLMQDERLENLILECPDQRTITKTRAISNGQQLIRLDEEEIKPLSAEAGRAIRERIQAALGGLNAIILSDYGKGLLQTPGLAQDVIAMGRERGIPVLVDPKGRDWTRYQGATCVTPNSRELEVFHGDAPADNLRLLETMQKTLAELGLDWLLVTRGALGMCLLGRDAPPVFISSQARQVYDVSGAGDTVIATLAVGAAAGIAFPDSARLANRAAGIVVGKLGTQPITSLELKASLHTEETSLHGYYLCKVSAPAAAALQVEAWKGSGEKIVFTNGCFDLLHPGHVHLLHRAKELGQRLVVGLNADSSVARLKGPSRPILGEHDRASILGALDCVDLVVIFQEDTPENLIRGLKPDILVKGADYRADEVVGRDIVESYGGSVRLIQVLEGYSTTNITRKMMQSNSGQGR